MFSKTAACQYTLTLTCVILFFWQSLSVTLLFYNEPVSTIFRKVHGNISSLEFITFCCTADDCLGAGRKSQGLQYARGFWPMQELPDDLDPIPTREDLDREMKQMSVDSPSEFLIRKSNFSIYHQDLGKRGRFPDPEWIRPPVQVMGSMSSKEDLICVTAPNILLGSKINTSHASRYFDSNDQMIRGEVTEIVFMVKFPAVEKLYISLHTGPLRYYFPKPYFQRIVQEDYVNSSISTYHRADIQRILKVSRRDYPCILPEANVKYPARFAEYACELDCDEKVTEDLYGCSYKSILKGIYETESKYCNKWELPTDSNTTTAYAKAWKTCVHERKCSQQHYCEEWDVRIQKTATLGPFKVVDKNMNVHRLKIFVAPQLTKIEEELIMSTAQWVASVGGLMGMYIGLSLMSIFGTVAACYAKCKDMKNKKLSIEDSSATAVPVPSQWTQEKPKTNGIIIKPFKPGIKY